MLDNRETREKMKKGREYLEKLKLNNTNKVDGRVLSEAEKQALLNSTPYHGDLEQKVKDRHLARIARHAKPSKNR